MIDDVLKKLFDDLSGEGFQTVWEYPECRALIPTEPGKEFFIAELPVVKFAPFDVAYARIYLRDGRIACCITFIFRDTFKDCITGEECNKEIEKHEFEWNRACQEHFGLIADYFALDWEIESIVPESDDEDCELIYRLEGSYDLETYTRIRTLLLETRELR